MKRFSAQKIHQLCAQLENVYSSAQIALEFSTPYQLLVAVMLSAQTTDKAVNKVTEKLFKKAPCPWTIDQLSLEELEHLLSTLGLYKAKARYLKELSAQLIRDYQGEVPDSLEKLIALPGVGIKTAYVVLNEAFGQDTMAVDTHIFRVLKKVGLSSASSPLKMMQELPQKIPLVYRKKFHHWVIAHGRQICSARKPLCLQCPIADLCLTRQKELSSSPPSFA